MAFKPSYNIMDRDTHNALVNAFQTGGIGYTDDDGSVHKIADDYVSGGGGGGRETLPTPAASNLGAALVVVKQNNSGAVIVPEQTLTLEDGGGTPENSNKSLFTVGTEVIAVINGVECIGVVEENDERTLVAFDYSNYRYGFSILDDTLVFFDEDWGETATIKLNVLETTYGYGLDEYPGYDIVISATILNNSLSSYTALKWDYPTIKQKVLNGEKIFGVLYNHYNYDELVDGDTCIHTLPFADIFIYSSTAQMTFKGFRGTTKENIIITFDPATGEFATVTAGSWS